MSEQTHPLAEYAEEIYQAIRAMCHEPAGAGKWSPRNVVRGRGRRQLRLVECAASGGKDSL